MIYGESTLRHWTRRVNPQGRIGLAEADHEAVHAVLSAPIPLPSYDDENEDEPIHRSQWLWIETPIGIGLVTFPHGEPFYNGIFPDAQEAIMRNAEDAI